MRTNLSAKAPCASFVMASPKVWKGVNYPRMPSENKSKGSIRMGVTDIKHPLTTPQQNIWNLQKYYPGTSIANVGGLLCFRAPYDYNTLNRAVNLLIEHNDALRLRFFEENGEPYQTVVPYIPESIPEYDMRGKTQADIDIFISNIMQKPFLGETLYRFAAIPLDNGFCGVLVCLHHMIGDAWSFSIIAEDITQYYLQILSGNVTPNPRPSYLNTVETERQYRSSPRFDKDEAYWNDVFAEKPHLCRIKETKETRDPKAQRYTRTLDGNLVQEIEAHCNQESVTPAVLFEAVLFAYLHRINEFASPVTIGIPVLNRSTGTEKKTIGMFISTVLLSVPIDENASMAELCRTVKQKHMETFRHQKYPMSHILQSIRSKGDDVSSLRDVMVSYQNARIDASGTEVTATWYHNGYSEVPLCVHIEDLGNTGGYKLHFDYQTAVMCETEVALLCDRLLHIMRQIVSDSDVKVCDIEIVAPAERERVINKFNDTAVDYPKDKCVHQLFDEQAERTPEKTAVVACDKVLSFAELNNSANRIANALTERGIKANDVIALILPRRSYYIAAMLGILKSGGAYMPLDVSYPSDRINYLLTESKAKMAITVSEYAEKIRFDGDAVLLHELLGCDNADTPKLLIKADSLFCALHTSGSTGLPKATGLTHGNINNFIITATQMFEGIETSLSTTAVSFDVFMQETLVALVCGIQVVFFNEEEISNQILFEAKVEQHDKCHIFQTPTKLESYIKNSVTKKFLQHIRTFIIGGEVFPTSLFKLIHRYNNNNNNTINVYGPSENTPYSSLCKLSQWKVFNGYGPTETTLGVCFSEINDIITIGKPIANTQIYILDKHLQPLPIGVTGELCISGDGVGRGYLNQPELTAEKFIPNPFIVGKRMYRTGDLARWREDGQLEYVGRADNQVKIRGLRIELGEIEAAIAKYDDIKQIVVVDKKDEAGRQYICAYYISDIRIDEKSLRAELAKMLPRYMVPHFFMQVDEFPTTTSGKTDRKAFPAPDFTQSYSVTQYVAPETEREKALIQIMEDVLGVSPIGMNDDFFELGGDSLKAIELAAIAHSKGVDFDLQSIFDCSSPAALIEHMSVKNEPSAQYIKADFEKFDVILNRNQINESYIPAKTDMGNLFLTGATGFLGAHILDTFLHNGTGAAYCLVRSNSNEEARKRLSDVLSYYFGEKYTNNQRIVAICGDITDTLAVDVPIHTVIHSAASVKHYGVYEHFRNINVTGTKNAIELARKNNANMIHISTLSVSGDSVISDSLSNENHERGFFTEKDLFINQSLDNVYIRSKFEAEVEVLKATTEGLCANIIRVGNLTNRYTDAKFQKNHTENAFVKRIKAILDLGLIPDNLLLYDVEFSPVDCVANAIIKIAQYFNEQYNIFHLGNDKHIRFGKMIEELGLKLSVVDSDTFSRALMEMMDKSDAEHTFGTLASEMGKDNKLTYDSNVLLNNGFTLWYLSKLGFSWPEIDVGYLTRYMYFFKGIGYFEVKNDASKK